MKALVDLELNRVRIGACNSGIATHENIKYTNNIHMIHEKIM